MFPTLMEHFQENGHIEDKFFEKVGFPIDEDIDRYFLLDEIQQSIKKPVKDQNV